MYNKYKSFAQPPSKIQLSNMHGTRLSILPKPIFLLHHSFMKFNHTRKEKEDNI